MPTLSTNKNKAKDADKGAKSPAAGTKSSPPNKGAKKSPVPRTRSSVPGTTSAPVKSTRAASKKVNPTVGGKKTRPTSRDAPEPPAKDVPISLLVPPPAKAAGAGYAVGDFEGEGDHDGRETEHDFLAGRSVSVDDFMRASNLVESNLEKLSKALERSLEGRRNSGGDGDDSMLNGGAAMGQSPPRHAASARDTGSVGPKRVSKATMDHVFALRVAADKLAEEAQEAKHAREVDQGAGAVEALENEDDEEAVEAAREVRAASTQGRSEEGGQDQADAASLAAAKTEAAEKSAENASLKQVVLELEAALARAEAEKQEIAKQFAAQQDELRMATGLIKETLDQVWELKAKQVEAQKRAKVRPRIEL